MENNNNEQIAIHIKQIELKIKDIKTANSVSFCKMASIDIICYELSGIVQELKEELELDGKNGK